MSKVVKVDFIDKRIQKWQDSLTPEQRLKMYVLSQMFDIEQLSLMISNGLSIDFIFSKIAIEMYKDG